MINTISRWQRIFVLLPLLLLAVAGCGGGLNPVHGKVAFDDDAPLHSGMVIFESKEGSPAVTARGEIQSDGTYRLGTRKIGDGAPAGVYRVLITPPPPEDPTQRSAKPPFDERYTDFRTSGLEFEVKSGSNEFPIQLTRNKKLASNKSH